MGGMTTMTTDLLQCALGVHRYDERLGKNRGFLCSICKRAKYYKGFHGYECWKEYDEKGNMIHYRNSCGDEWWNEYNEEGNLLHWKDSNGNEECREYDKKGNLIHYKDSGGDEFSYNESQMNKDLLQCALGVHRFDKKIKSNPNCLLCSICKRAKHCKDSDGYEWQAEYDENGRKIHFRDSTGYEYWNEYSKKGVWIRVKYSDSFACWKEYDANGNGIHFRDSYGRERQ